MPKRRKTYITTGGAGYVTAVDPSAIAQDLRNRAYRTVQPTGYTKDNAMNFFIGGRRVYGDPNTEGLWGKYTNQDSIIANSSQAPKGLPTGRPLTMLEAAALGFTPEEAAAYNLTKYATSDIVIPSRSKEGAYELAYPNQEGNIPHLPYSSNDIEDSRWAHSHQLGTFHQTKTQDGDNTTVSYEDIWDVNPFRGQSSSDDSSWGWIIKTGKAIGLDKAGDVLPFGKPFEVYGEQQYDKKGKPVNKKEEGGWINIDFLKPKDAWDKLSLREKAEMMRAAIRNGITNLKEIREKYNEFAEGGDITDNEYYNTMQRVAEENNPLWNKLRKEEGIQPLTVDEEYMRVLNDNTYDYRGFYNENPDAAANADTHWPDTYKTVWHPTFSTESIYSGQVSKYNPEGLYGGHWVNGEFIPAPWQRVNIHSEGGNLYWPGGFLSPMLSINWNKAARKAQNLLRYSKGYLKHKLLGDGEGTFIDLSDKNVARVKGNTKDITSILTNDFVEKKKNTVRKKKDFVHTNDTLLGDNQIPLSNISTYYGIEDGKLKAGDLTTFRDETTVIPNRTQNTGRLKKILVHNRKGDKWWGSWLTDEDERVIDEYNQYKGYKVSDADSKPSDVLKRYEGKQAVDTVLDTFRKGITEKGDTIVLPELNATPKMLFANEAGNAAFISNLRTPENVERLNEYLAKHPSYPVMVDNGRYVEYQTENPDVDAYSGLDSPDNMFIVGTTKALGGNLFAPGGEITYGAPHYLYDENGQLVRDASGKPVINYNATLSDITIIPDSQKSPADRNEDERFRQKSLADYDEHKQSEWTTGQVAKSDNTYKKSTTSKVLNTGKTITSGIKTAAEFVPITGDVIQGLDATKDAMSGDYLAAGLGLGMLAVPNVIEKPLKYFGKGLKNIFEITDSQWDEAYNAAIKVGDMGEAQKLRDLHFMAKNPENRLTDSEGNPIKMIHGSQAKFTEFRHKDNPYGTHGRGMYFGIAPENGKTGYGGANGQTYLTYLNGKSIYPDFGILIRDNAGKAIPNQIMYEIIGTNSYDEFINSVTKQFKDKFERDTFYDLKNIEKNIDRKTYQRLHDSFDTKLSGVHDIHKKKHWFRKDEKYATFNPARAGEIVVRDANQIKLADAITYDDAGNIIPLSKRDSKLPDIRYGLLPFGIGLTGYGLFNNQEALGGKIKKRRRF